MASHSSLSNPKLLEPEDLTLPLGNDDLLIQVTSHAVSHKHTLRVRHWLNQRSSAAASRPQSASCQYILATADPEPYWLPPRAPGCAYDDEGGGWAGNIVGDGCYWSC